MAIVNYLEGDQAPAEVKDIFEQVKGMTGGQVPPPFKAMANHPEYLKIVLNKMQVIMGSSEIDKKSKLMVAFVISTLNNCELCINQYAQQLKEEGFTDKQFVELMGLIDLVGSMNHLNNGMRISAGK